MAARHAALRAVCPRPCVAAPGVRLVLEPTRRQGLTCGPDLAFGICRCVCAHPRCLVAVTCPALKSRQLTVRLVTLAAVARCPSRSQCCTADDGVPGQSEPSRRHRLPHRSNPSNRAIPRNGTLLSVCNESVIFSLEILSLYWNSLPFRGSLPGTI